MTDELEPSPEQHPRGVGWLLRPAAAGELRLDVSGVEEAEALTPEVRQTLEELMNGMQEELRVVAALRTCTPLRDCGTNKVDCPQVVNCGTYT